MTVLQVWRRWRRARRTVLLYHTHADARCLVSLPAIVGTVMMQPGDEIEVHLIVARGETVPERFPPLEISAEGQRLLNEMVKRRES
jgi:hypothetical protein